MYLCCMQNEIVHLEKGEIFTTSKIVAEMLGVQHKVLLNTIKPIVERIKNNGTAKPMNFPQKFIESSFINKMGRTYLMYDINEQAYLKLAMRLSGYEKAEIVQDAIIESFSLMKQALLNHENATWLSVRNEGKQVRLAEMDIVKEFVEYATKQGSTNAKFYYANITKMTNKALELLIQTKIGSPIRDLATIHQLGYIRSLEERALDSIKWGMANNLHYKHIYTEAKNEVNKLADSLCFKPKLSI